MAADTYTQYAPFAAINDFMLADFRLKVIQHVYSNLSHLPDSLRQPIDFLTKSLVIVPGFRNSAKAPPALKSRNAVQPFEKSSEFVSIILYTWAQLMPELGVQVYELLSKLGWEVLPVGADRTKMPGFLPKWPDQHNFISLNDLFTSLFPQTQYSSDEISLMIVWISLCLPYDQEVPDETSYV